MRLKHGIIAGVFLVIAAFFVTAGDVIVKNGELNVTQNLLVDSDTLYVDSVNNMVGMGTNNPTQVLTAFGTFNMTRTDGNAQIYENATCTIIKGATSTMEIC